MNISWSGVIEKIIAGLAVFAIATLITSLISGRFKVWIKSLFRSAFLFVSNTWRYSIAILLIASFHFVLYYYFAQSWQVIILCFSFMAILFTITYLFSWSEAENPIPLIDYNFSNAQHSISAHGAGQPTFDHRGIELIPHNGLTNFITINGIPNFSEGNVECEVYLTIGAIINFVFWGNLGQRNSFYMARLDTRNGYNDSILFNPPGGHRWLQCNPIESLRYRTPNDQWVRMRITIRHSTVKLFRDGIMVDKIENGHNRPSNMGFFAEEGNVYIRRIKVL